MIEFVFLSQIMPLKVIKNINGLELDLIKVSSSHMKSHKNDMWAAPEIGIRYRSNESKSVQILEENYAEIWFIADQDTISFNAIKSSFSRQILVNYLSIDKERLSKVLPYQKKWVQYWKLKTKTYVINHDQERWQKITIEINTIRSDQ